MAYREINRREALKLMLGSSTAACFSWWNVGCSNKPSVNSGRLISGKPNILVIMSDDQGAGDVGYVGNKWAKTPVIDSFAAESAVFTNFIAAPACTPSRASFLTGRNYNHTGVWGVGPRGYIRRDETFLPEYLRRGGYRTAHFGKWGEGWTPDQRTYNRGYDEAVALGGGYQHRDSWADNNGTLEKLNGWTTDVIADLTIDFIRRCSKSEQPWYAIAAYIAPHSPWECAPEYFEPLLKKGYSRPMAAFYGMIAQMDKATGRILEELDRLAISENTVVIFVSDNGATPLCMLTGGTPVGSEDWENRNYLNLRGEKSTVWENGIRVPFAMRLRGTIQPGNRDQFSSYEDILPTILDITGIPDSVVPNHLPIHGISLKPMLLDQNHPEQERYYFRIPVSMEGSPSGYPELIIEDPTKLRYTDYHTCLYAKKFKYHSLPGGFDELYDMETDPGETKDISDLYPAVKQKMAALCKKQWNELIESGRGFWMPTILIGDPRYADMKRCWAHLPPNVVPCNTAQRVSGTVICPFEGLRGYTRAGDSAVFSIDVRTADDYEINIIGDDLDTCSPLVINVNGLTLNCKKTSKNKVEFGTVKLPVAIMEISIEAIADGQSQAYMRELHMIPLSA